MRRKETWKKNLNWENKAPETITVFPCNTTKISLSDSEILEVTTNNNSSGNNHKTYFAIHLLFSFSWIRIFHNFPILVQCCIGQYLLMQVLVHYKCIECYLIQFVFSSFWWLEFHNFSRNEKQRSYQIIDIYLIHRKNSSPWSFSLQYYHNSW